MSTHNVKTYSRKAMKQSPSPRDRYGKAVRTFYTGPGIKKAPVALAVYSGTTVSQVTPRLVL
jgi:hypothetical protein